jgi:hypothetical protein
MSNPGISEIPDLRFEGGFRWIFLHQQIKKPVFTAALQGKFKILGG